MENFKVLTKEEIEQVNGGIAPVLAVAGAVATAYAVGHLVGSSIAWLQK